MLPMIPNNALDAGIQPRQLILGPPLQNEGLDHAVAQVDQNVQEAQVRMLHVAFEVGLKIGEGTQTLRLEKLQLESENRKLEQNIAKVKMTFLAETKSTIDKFEARKSAITVKLQGIIDQLVLARACVPNDVFSFDRMTELLNHLTKQYSSFDYDGFRKYNEFSEEKNMAEPLANKIIVSLTDFPIFQENLPVIKTVSLLSFKEFKVLQDQAATLRSANLELVKKIEIMKVLHARRIRELHQSENKHLILLANRVGATKTLIDWEVKLVSVGEMFARIRLNGYDPRTQWCQALLQAYCNTPEAQQCRLQYQAEINKVEERLKEVILMIEGFINHKEEELIAGLIEAIEKLNNGVTDVANNSK